MQGCLENLQVSGTRGKDWTPQLKYLTTILSLLFFLLISPALQILVNPSLSCCHMGSNYKRAGEQRESRSFWSLAGLLVAYRNAVGMYSNLWTVMTFCGILTVLDQKDFFCTNSILIFFLLSSYTSVLLHILSVHKCPFIPNKLPNSL